MAFVLLFNFQDFKSIMGTQNDPKFDQSKLKKGIFI